MPGIVAFSPDDTLLATASRDGSTRVWDVTTGLSLATAAASGPAPSGCTSSRTAGGSPSGYADGEVEVRDLDFFFRYAAGHGEYQLNLFRNAGEIFPRANEVIAWSRGVRSAR